MANPTWPQVFAPGQREIMRDGFYNQNRKWRGGTIKEDKPVTWKIAAFGRPIRRSVLEVFKRSGGEAAEAALKEIDALERSGTPAVCVAYRQRLYVLAGPPRYATNL